MAYDEAGGEGRPAMNPTHADANGHYIEYVDPQAGPRQDYHSYWASFWDCRQNRYFARVIFRYDIKVRWNHDTPGINIVLPVGAAIAGKVTDASNGNPIGGICVDYYDDNDPAGEGWEGRVVRVYTKSDGTYHLGGMLAGTDAFILFADCAPRRYVREWWDNHTVPNGQDALGTVDEADHLQGSELRAGKIKYGIDAALDLR